MCLSGNFEFSYETIETEKSTIGNSSGIRLVEVIRIFNDTDKRISILGKLWIQGVILMILCGNY